MKNKNLIPQKNYLYGVHIYDEEEITYYNTIVDALVALTDTMPLFLTEDLPAEVKIAVFERGDLFKPSEYNAFELCDIRELLDSSDSMVQERYFPEAEIFGSLTDEQVQKLIGLINNFLDENINTDGFYKQGKLVTTLTLTRAEYLKYLNGETVDTSFYE